MSFPQINFCNTIESVNFVFIGHETVMSNHLYFIYVENKGKEGGEKEWLF